jgi:hypothetical protein
VVRHGPGGLESEQHYADGDGSDARVDDEAGDRERDQALPGGFESNREEADDEDDDTDDSHEYGHG